MAEAKKSVTPKKKYDTIVTPIATAGFSWLAKPDSGGKFSDDKYKVTLFMTKGDPDHEKFVKMIDEAHRQARGRKATESPVKDGDDRNEYLVEQGKEPRDENKGKYLLTFKSQFAPQLLGKGKVELAPEQAPKSGDRVQVAFAMVPYSEGKNAGVSLQMRAVKLVEKRAGADYSSAFGDDDEGEDVADSDSGEAGAEDSNADFQ